MSEDPPQAGGTLEFNSGIAFTMPTVDPRLLEHERREQTWPTNFRLALTDNGLELQGEFIWRMVHPGQGWVSEQGTVWRTIPTVDLRSPPRTLRERILRAAS